MVEVENLPGWGERFRLAKPTLWSGRYYRRRGVTYYVEVLDTGVTVSVWRRRDDSLVWLERFQLETIDWATLSGEESVMGQWIQKAVGRRAEAPKAYPAYDEWLYKGRPAIQEFMTELQAGKGEAREPSVLMICPAAAGIRVGLKDEGAGGWLWREAKTVAEALDSIEAALQSGNVVWAVPGGKGNKNRGK